MYSYLETLILRSQIRPLIDLTYECYKHLDFLKEFYKEYDHKENYDVCVSFLVNILSVLVNQ